MVKLMSPVSRRWSVVAALAVLGLIGRPPASGAQGGVPDSLGAHVDRVFARFGADTPGCAIGVYQGATVVLARGYGLANLEHRVPITPQTPFITGSVSKQFTAAAIALLAQDGVIGLDDDVRRWVPELPGYGAPITVRQLVHHTSGLRDFWALVGLAGLRYDDTYTMADMLAIAARQRELNFAPGTQHLYSNTGYIVMATIVERASGMPLRVFAEQRIFAPLGMRESRFHDDHTRLVPGRAAAYSPAAGGYAINIWNNDLVGQGGVITTVLDLAHWHGNFSSGAVGGAPFLARQLERGRLADGTALSYAFGVQHGQYRGVPVIEHTGSTGGYRSVFLRFPSADRAVAVLCNVSNADPATLARRVAEVAVGGLAAQPTAPVTPQEGQAAQAAQPSSPALAGATVTAPAALSAALLELAPGAYWSPELEATYRIERVGPALVLHRPRAAADTLRAGTAPLELVGSVGTLRVQPGGAGFLLDAGRVRNLVFSRR
jgi:CubicO group peptidase (beta-lactamase class C family)